MSASESNLEARVSCTRCGTHVPSHLSRCGVCGAPLDDAIPIAEMATATPTQNSTLGGLADKPWLILVTIFFVTAAFGIPLIWMCRAWSDMTKAILTIVTIVYTIFILWLFYLVMAWCWSRISDSF